MEMATYVVNGVPLVVVILGLVKLAKGFGLLSHSREFGLSRV